MKKLTYLMALVVMFTAIISASAEKQMPTFPDDAKQGIKGMSLIDVPHKDINSTNAKPTFRAIDTVDHARFSMFVNTTPFVYDPLDNTLYFTRIHITYGDNFKIDNVIDYSANLGTNWSINQVTDMNPGYQFLRPSLTVGNYDQGSPNFATAPIFLLGDYFDNSPTDNFVGKLYLYNDGSELIPDLITSPDDNNPDDYAWGFMRGKTMYADGEAISYNVSLLSPPQSGMAHSHMGIFGWHFNANEQFISQIPEPWEALNFEQSSQGGTYMGPVELDFDDNANIYMAINAAFAGNSGSRNVAVSKSEDMGLSFADWNFIPENVLEEFFIIEKTEEETMYGPYGQYTKESFVAYGDNQYSYFMQLSFGYVEDNAYRITRVLLVEVYYNNNTWGLRKITDQMQGIPSMIYMWEQDQVTQKYKFVYADNPRGNELQAAKTADGEHILIKFINISHDTTLASNVELYDASYDGTQMVYTLEPRNVFYTSDIYVSYRKLNDAAWSEPENLTQTIFNEHGSMIPDVVPSINEVPVLALSPLVYTGSAIDHIPTYVQTLSTSFSDLVIYALYDAGTVGVDPETNYNFTLNNATPNPASEYCYIPYTLEETSNITLELYNALGQKVDLLDNGIKYPGPQSVRVKLTDFPSGAYYYTMTVGSQRLTRSLSIVR